MDSQKEEADMSREIVQGVPRKAVHRPRLGIADKIALGLTGLGLGSLVGTAIEAQNQTPPPQVTPDQRGSIPPPKGVTFPEGVRADSPVPGAPVETPLPFRVLLPNITNKAVETLTPEQQVERFIATTQVVDKVEQVRNNKTYSVETRITPQATHQVVVKEELKDRVAQLVAKDGEKNGFTKAQVVILKPEDQLPEGVSLRGTRVNVNLDQDPNARPIWVRIGSFAQQQIGNRIILYFAPDPNLPRDNQTVMRRVNDALTDRLFSLAISGDYLGNVAAAYRENPEYLNLIEQEALSLVFL